MSSPASPPPAAAPQNLNQLVDAMLQSYRVDPRANRVGRRYLPSRDEIVQIIKLLLQLMYPGYYGRQDLDDTNVGYHVGVLLCSLREKLLAQVELSLSYQDESERGETPDVKRCKEEAARVTRLFLERLPAV